MSLTQLDAEPNISAPLDREELAALQLHGLQACLARAASSGFYRRHWASAPFDRDDIRSLDDFAHVVPRMTKSDVLADQAAKPPFGELLSVERRDLADIHVTSGTSGLGQGAFGLTRSDTRLGGTGYARFWYNAGLRPGDLIVLTHPVSFFTGGRMALAAAELTGIVVYYGFGMDKRALLSVAGQLGASAIFGTPNVLRDIERVLDEDGLSPTKLLPDLKAIFLGLTGAPWIDTVSRIRGFWGVQVHENYGLTEGLSVAVSCRQGVWDGTRKYPMHFNEDLLYCEVLDPETGIPVAAGEPGELTITTFRRQASPVIRYRTGDRVIKVAAAECPCGSCFDGLLPGAISRYDDMLKVKGTTLWPATIDDLVLSTPEVDEYRVVVDSVDGREKLRISVAFIDGVHADRRRGVLDSIGREVKLRTLITADLVEVDSLEHFTYKAKRWTDNRES